MFKSVLTHYRSRNYAFENVFLGLPHKLIIVITINGNERYIHFFTFYRLLSIIIVIIISSTQAARRIKKEGGQKKIAEYGEVESGP